MKKLLAVFVLIISAGIIPAHAGGLALMRIDAGPRPSGMGGAFVSIPAHIHSSIYNPAGATGTKKFSIAFGHTSYWENVRLESGFFATNLSQKTALHGHIRFAAVDNLEGRALIPSTTFEEFDVHDISFKTGLSYQITPKLSAGAGIGLYFEKIEAWRGNRANFDLGVLYAASPRINLGASATSIGSDFTISKSNSVNSRPIELPTTIRLGGSYHLDRYLGALDLVVVDDEARVHLGAEAEIHPLFLLRSGYMFNYDSKNITAGFSFKKRNLVIDYAFVPYSNELGSSHLFSLTFSI